MRTLYHVWLSPFCRNIRILLAEKKLEFQTELEPVWERRPGFLALNPAGEVPVLVETDGTAVCDGAAIAEYLEEVYPEPPMMGETPARRAEVRRLVAWFDRKFNAEVTENLVGEKIVKRLAASGQPDSCAIRAGHANIQYHLQYVAYLWSAGPGWRAIS